MTGTAGAIPISPAAELVEPARLIGRIAARETFARVNECLSAALCAAFLADS